MLREFKVKNFKNFKDWFTFDLTNTKNYTFNTECIKNNIVSTMLIYGANGCGKSNLGHAIFDIKTHLSDTKIDPIYNNYLNADGKSELAEFVFTFQFGENILEYSYGKKSVEDIVYEVLKINNSEVIALDRRDANIATVDLKGAENLNRNLENTNISVVKYVKSNTSLEKDAKTETLTLFLNFIESMSLLRTVNSHKLVSINPTQFSKMILQVDKGDVTKFEQFLNDAKIECKLATIEIDGEKRIAFKYQSKKIDFYQCASTGALTLTELYIHLRILQLNIENIVLKHSDMLPFVFIDEFDAFYHYAISRSIVSNLKNSKCQAILTTHNTSIMSNDLLRPDCYFIMTPKNIKPMHSFTKKELRSAHNIEKMYRAGAFNE